MLNFKVVQIKREDGQVPPENLITSSKSTFPFGSPSWNMLKISEETDGSGPIS